MKKVFTILFAVSILFLTACGNKDIKTTKSCSIIKNEVGYDFNLSATNDIVDYIEINMTITPNYLGIDSLKTLNESTKESYKKAILKELGLYDKSYEGLEIITDISENMVVTYKIDLTKISDETLKLIDFDIIKDKNIKLTDFVNESINEGFECK